MDVVDAADIGNSRWCEQGAVGRAVGRTEGITRGGGCILFRRDVGVDGGRRVRCT